MRSDRRLHPLSPVFIVASTLRAFLLPVLFGIVALRWSPWDSWLPLLAIPYLLYGIVRYVTYRYKYAEEDLVIRTGFLFRNERHIPYTRIHNIGSVQSLFHRMLGVVEVRVETAGGPEPEARIRVLSVAAMEEMRSAVHRAKGQEPAATEEVSGDEAQPDGKETSQTLLHLPPRELALLGIIDNRGMVVVAAAMGLAWELGRFGDGDFFPSADSIKRMLRGVGEAASPFLNVGLIVVALVAFVIVLRLFSMARSLIKLYDFRLERSGRDVTMTAGLFTRVTTTIPLNRIQTVSVKQKPLHRLFGRAEVHVATAGAAKESEEGVLEHRRLAPIIRMDRVPELVAAVQPGVDLEPPAWLEVDPRAFRRILRRSLVVLVGATALGLAPLGWWSPALAAVLLPLVFWNARQQVRYMGYGLTPDLVLYRSGWLWRHMSMVRFSKIQALTLGESPFDRRYRMAGLSVDTAGAVRSGHRVEIPYLDRGDARRLKDRLGAEAARTAFRW